MTRTIPRFARVFTLRMHYVVSDVHGHVGHLVEGLGQAGLVDSARSWCGGHAGLTFLGDYFDRGPDDNRRDDVR